MLLHLKIFIFPISVPVTHSKYTPYTFNCIELVSLISSLQLKKKNKMMITILCYLLSSFVDHQNDGQQKTGTRVIKLMYPSPAMFILPMIIHYAGGIKK